MVASERIDRRAVPAAIVRQRQQRAHLVEREAEIASATDERQATQLGRAIGAVIARRPRGPRQQPDPLIIADGRSEEHTSELQSLMRISYAVFCLKKKTNKKD